MRIVEIDGQRVVEADREQAKELARSASWAESAAIHECPGCACGEGRRMIHTITGFGCDIDLDTILADIDEADDAVWVDHWMNHHLALRCKRLGGSWMRVDVPAPAEARSLWAEIENEQTGVQP